MTSEAASYKGGPSGAEGYAAHIKAGQQEGRKKHRKKGNMDGHDDDDDDDDRRGSQHDNRKGSHHSQDKHHQHGVHDTMGLPQKQRKQTGFEKWQAEGGQGAAAEQKNKGHAALRRQRSNSLDGVAFTSKVGNSTFAKYNNDAIHHGLGSSLRTIPDEDDKPPLFGRKTSFADPVEKQKTIDGIRGILENHNGTHGETDRHHPDRPRRMGSKKHHHHHHKHHHHHHHHKHHDQPHDLVQRQSSGDWSNRLGGGDLASELAHKLDFLRDKGEEDHIRRVAEREAASKSNGKRDDKTWNLREEREVFWARTASHH